jgi:hypothetical protein
MKRHQQPRITKVSDILPIVRGNIENIKDFFRYDRSLIVSKFRLKPDVDPRLVFLLATLEGEEPLEAQFRRLLTSRYLAKREENWNQHRRNGWVHADIVRLPNYYREGPSFLQSEGLWEHREYVSISLSQGRRSRRIEINTGIEGISYALLPIFPRLPHLQLAEEDALIQELLGGSWDDILQLGRDLSPLAGRYQPWFEHEITILIGSWRSN